MIPSATEQEVFFQRSKQHAEKLDFEFGFEIAKVEQDIAKFKNIGELAEKETWNHLSPQVFQTPYIELRFILESILSLKAQLGLPSESCRIVDLGAAYFRLAFVVRLLFKEQFTIEGFEICSQRVLEARRVYQRFFGEPLQNLHTSDLAETHFQIPIADIYFLYDFGTTSDIERLLEKLLRRCRNFLLVARGARIDSVIWKHYAKTLVEYSKNQNYSFWIFPTES